MLSASGAETESMLITSTKKFRQRNIKNIEIYYIIFRILCSKCARFFFY